MKHVLLIGLTLSACPVQAQMQVPNLAEGNGYLEACTTSEPVSRAVCTQYTLGMEGMLLALQVGGFTKRLECVPDETTDRQRKDIFLKFLQDTPEVRHLPTPRLYLLAMQRAFPCPPDPVMPPVDKRM